GAKKGDLICVSGDLGGAFLGLTILEREKKIFLETKGVQPDLEGQDYIVGRILKPEARKDIIEYFAAEDIKPTAMIDISDGLSSEILHICKQSDVGCMLYESKFTIHDMARQFSYKLDIDPIASALSGGAGTDILIIIYQTDNEMLTTNN